MLEDEDRHNGPPIQPGFGQQRVDAQIDSILNSKNRQLPHVSVGADSGLEPAVTEDFNADELNFLQIN